MLNLSHILPPNSTSQNRPDSDTVSTSSAHTLCPKALIGRISASTPLHLAIAHQLGEKRWKGHVKQRDSGVDDLTGPIGVVRTEQKDQVDSSRNTLIIASERSRWHESLVDENDSWIRDYGAIPEVSDALQRIQIKYCSTPKDALILLSLLHPAPAKQPQGEEEDASSIIGGVPDLAIAWDLFSLFLEPQDEGGVDEVPEEDVMPLEQEERKKDPRIRAGCTVQDYLALISMLKQAIDQISPPATSQVSPLCNETQVNLITHHSQKPELIVLEPQITSSTELALPHPQSTVPDTTVPGSVGKHERRLKLVTGLEWILAPGYREVGKGHTVLEIAEGCEEDEQEGMEAPPRKFAISTLSGDIVAAFEQRQEDQANGKPWLDRVATVYRWL